VLASVYPLCYNAFGVPYKLQKGVSKIARLAQVRQEKGMTQEQLAAATGVHRVTIARIETGEVSPKAETLMKLADALGVLMDDLMDRGAG
jgi:transcriptional regulator with XRE-family HTH domain